MVSPGSHLVSEWIESQRMYSSVAPASPAFMWDDKSKRLLLLICY